MKRLPIIALLLIYLCSSTCLGELLKVPVLLSHFTEHKAGNDATTFYLFLYQHYQGDDGDDSDNATDSQLPFKSCNTGHMSGIGFLLPLTDIRLKPFSAVLSRDLVLYREQYIPSACLSRIWQPPKSC